VVAVISRPLRSALADYTHRSHFAQPLTILDGDDGSPVSDQALAFKFLPRQSSHLVAADPA
jgi:hypothetical protein